MYYAQQNMGNKDRSRKWFIEINPRAECYSEDIIQMELASCTNYAYIMHTKELDENGEKKDPHYHIYLEYENARAFNSMKNRFKGAHIEMARSKEYCIQYLIHKNQPLKEQYSINDVKSNMVDIMSYLEVPYYETFNPSKIILYIKEGTATISAFYKRFGHYIQTYLRLITTLINDVEQQEQIECRLYDIDIEVLMKVVQIKMENKLRLLEKDTDNIHF